MPASHNHQYHKRAPRGVSRFFDCVELETRSLRKATFQESALVY
jgi:hypothetical protein